MRKLYAFLFTVLLLLTAPTIFSQVSNYAFSQSNGSYTAITGGTLLGNTTSDDERFVDPAVPLGGFTSTGPGFPIGFTFNYNGVNFDRIAVNNNGWICFGQSTLTPSVDMNTTSAYTPLASTATNTPALLRNRIAGMGRDIQAQAGAELRIQTTGAAPNRRCVIQYAGYKRFGTAGTGDNINFQIVLNETTNIVQAIYGTMVLNNVTTASSINHVGLGGTTATDFNNRQTAVPHDWATTTAGTTNAQGVQNPTATIAVTMPVSGLTFAWTPPAPCTGVPSPGLISGPSSINCSGGGGTLTLGGFTVAPGITFQWRQASTPGGPYTIIPGATNSTYAFTITATTYYICTVTCTASGLSSNTTEFRVTVTSRPVHSAVSATPSTTCTPGASAITGTVSGGVTISGVGVIVSSGTINLAITDNSPAGVNSSLTVPASTSLPAAGDLRIRINANHTWVGDLRFTLTSPCGSTFLFDRPGVPASGVGNSDNLAGVYTFDLAGATVIPETAGSGTVAPGTYRPSDAGGAPHNWAGLTFPCAAAGNWTLNVSDNALLDAGTLVDWAIIGPSSGNYSHTLTGPGTITQNASTGPNNSTGNFSVTALPAGTHNFTLTSTDVTGCSVSSPVSVTVNQTPAITIAPAAPVICSGAIQQLTATVVPGILQTVTGGPAITVNALGNGTPYPANLAVSGFPTTGVTVKSVTLNGVSHSFPRDMDILLQSPTGVNVVLMSDVQGTGAITGRTYTFDDAAAASLNPNAADPSGTYKPTNNDTNTDTWPAPGPGVFVQATPTIATFGAADVNGTWKLFVVDDLAGDGGTIASWSITFSQPAPVVFTPVTNLFTNATATIPYVAGTPVTTVWTNAPTTTTYTATAVNAGCTNTANVTVTVNQLPAITTQPAALAAPVCPGFNVTYTVGATGAGLTYQWQLSTDGGTTYNNLVNNPPYSGVTTSSLLITSVTTAMTNYRYRCVVSGTCPPAVTSNAVTLVVATTPTITTNPANLTICANANAVFSVVTAGIPAATIFQWQVSTDAGATWTNLATGGAFSPTFTITAATTALSGNRYRVIVTNNCGQTVTSTAATLTVNVLPVVSVTSLASTKICLSDTLVPLAGLPVGGSWSGAGVSGFNFVPGVTAVGTFTLTYSFTNTFGCTATVSTIAKVEDCPERQRLLRDDAVILYPNPNSGQFFLRMNSTLYNYLGVKVYNMTGQLVNGNVVNEAVSSPTYSGLVYGRVIPVNLGNLPSGTYMVKVYYDDGVRTSEKGFLVVIGR